MIVLKATQDKVLSVLQSVAGIVERRHTLPILANVLVRKTGNVLRVEAADLPDEFVLVCSSTIARAVQKLTSMLSIERNALTHALRGQCRGSLSRNTRPNGFFSASKANQRNAP
jgi:hypothetical protein